MKASTLIAILVALTGSGPVPMDLNPVLPDRIELEIPASESREVFVRKFAVRVDSGLDSATIRARIVDWKNHRWLSLTGPSTSMNVVSPSTQIMEILVDPATLLERSASAVIEVLGARRGKLRLPVSLRIVDEEGKSRSDVGSGAQVMSEGTGVAAVRRLKPTDQKRPEKTSRESALRPPAAQSANTIPSISPGDVTPRSLTFLVNSPAESVKSQVLAVRLPSSESFISPVITYYVGKTRALSASGPSGKSSVEASPVTQSLDWLSVLPEGETQALEGETPTHVVRADPAGLKPGIYRGFLLFDGLVPSSSIPVLVTMTIR